MAGIYPREAVRVKVKKCEPNSRPEWRKFSVDPQITTLEVLYSLLAKAFEIKADFTIKYKAFDPAGNEIYLAVRSDWDLDAAFLRIHNISIQTSSEPCLMLQIDVKPFTVVRECDTESTTKTVDASRDLISPLQSLGVSQKYVQHMQTKLPGLIMNQMEKTFSIVQKAFNLSEEHMANLPPRPPMCDSEFRLFLDALGQIQRKDELHKVIFLGGIEPSLRRVVWKHLLNVYPSGLNGLTLDGHQRMEFIRRKCEQYCRLRDNWKKAIKQANGSGGELAYVTSMVKKDVLRTDRLHPFYAGSDDNQNIASLFNILTTYALNHPTVSYCQGMSDIASPLLVTMNDEAQAYICFCGIMSRVRGNFMLDGIAMTQKFAHLTEALSYYDPEFWEYLKSQQADDLLFCYRWLLLELKREFPFEDALLMLEVQWSSLRYDQGPNGTAKDKELPLYEKEFVPQLDLNSAPNSASTFSGSYSATPTSPSYLLSKQRENPYTKVCALRRQSSSASLSSLSSSLGAAVSSHTLDHTRRLNHSLDDSITRRRQQRISAKAHQSLDETKMLALIELAKESKLIQDEDTEDDEVFDRTEPFLESNPFKDDLHQETTNSGKSPARAFLCSDSSSLNLDENIPLASQLSESLKRVTSSGGGHFKDLKQKIAATSRLVSETDPSKTPPKLVKNFNEFLNFAALNKNRISDRFNQQMQISQEKPPLQLTKSPKNTSPDESDSSSLPETSWSASTAATAIQQQDLNDQEYYPMTNTAITREMRLESENLDRQVFGLPFTEHKPVTPLIEYEQLDKDSLDLMDDLKENEIINCPDVSELLLRRRQRMAANKSISVQPQPTLNPFMDENSHLPLVMRNSSSLPEVIVPVSSELTNTQPLVVELATKADEAAERNGLSSSPATLPPPGEFGGGNAFLMFLCLTLLLQHRNTIMKAAMDYNEIAMHFDKMVRKHDVTRVLNQARRMYIEYLKAHSSQQRQQQQQVNNPKADGIASTKITSLEA